PQRNRMVAAQDKRKAFLVGGAADQLRDVPARLEDLVQEARPLVTNVRRLGDMRAHVAPVVRVASERANALGEPRVADRRRPHVDAAAPGAEVECGSNDRYGLHSGKKATEAIEAGRSGD